MTRPVSARAPGAGFTFVELLVVVGVIAVLAGLILPGISLARFRSQVARCTNQYRQWSVASSLYASDDGKGRLPSFALPVERMTHYQQIEPWWVAFDMVTNMAAHGVTTPMWFCPTRERRGRFQRENFRLLRGRELSTPADLVDEFEHVQKTAFAFVDLFWWVPRKLNGSSLEFPNPKLMETRIPDPWPMRMDDPTISTMPIITDWILGQWDEAARTAPVNGGSGGHSWSGSLLNVNVGFADGHVETRPKAKLEWQAKGRGDHAYVY